MARGSIMKRILCFLVLSLTFSSCHQASPSIESEHQLSGQSSKESSSFMLMALPDTQYYSAFHPQHFEKQTSWLAQHATKLDVKLTMHLGDVVDAVIIPCQWNRADKAMKTLEEAKVPYSILAGNHDIFHLLYRDDSRNPKFEEYLKRFTPERAAQNSTFIERDPSGWNEYHIIEGAGEKYLVFALDWKTSLKSLDWVKQILRRYPNLPAIVTTHDLVGYTMSGQSQLSKNGQFLWDNLIKDEDQIFLTLNGHDYTKKLDGAYIQRENNFGNKVHMVLIDYQNGYQGGQGYMRALEFDIARNRIEMTTFSPSIAAGMGLQPGKSNPVELTAPGSKFFVEIPFKKRFAKFAPNFKEKHTPRSITWSDQLRTILKEEKPEKNNADLPSLDTSCSF